MAVSATDFALFYFFENMLPIESEDNCLGDVEKFSCRVDMVKLKYTNVRLSAVDTSLGRQELKHMGAKFLPKPFPSD